MIFSFLDQPFFSCQVLISISGSLSLPCTGNIPQNFPYINDNNSFWKISEIFIDLTRKYLYKYKWIIESETWAEQLRPRDREWCIYQFA